MRRAVALPLGLLVSLMTGCAAEGTAVSASVMDKFRNLEMIHTAHLVQVEIRLLECRVGDDYINQEIWDSSLDEQVVEFTRRGNLKNNGFRIGQMVGMVPPQLHDLMTLERSCVNPRKLLIPAGKSNKINLGPVLSTCRYQIEKQNTTQAEELHNAQCSLVVLPSLTDDGNTHLRFMPMIEYGERTHKFRPVTQQSGWTDWVMDIQKQKKVYPELSWEVTLAPNTFLVIGCWLEKLDSLGFGAFVDREARPPVQRLLVLRTNRSGNAGIDAEIAPPPNLKSQTSKSPPLALQATQPVTRANHN